AAAEQLPCILAEPPLLSDGGLGAKRLPFRKSCEIGYELVVVDERAFQRWVVRRRSVVIFDVEAWDAGVSFGGVCHGPATNRLYPAFPGRCTDFRNGCRDSDIAISNLSGIAVGGDGEPGG